MVIPKPLRDRVGIGAGEIEISVVGAALRLEPLSAERLAEEEGRLVIPASGNPIDDQVVEALRRADQR